MEIYIVSLSFDILTGAKVASPEIQKCFDWPAETLRIFLYML